MSRSRRKYPTFQIACAKSEKWDKAQCHRYWRMRLRANLAHERWDDARHDDMNNAADSYSWNKDGKHWFELTRGWRQQYKLLRNRRKYVLARWPDVLELKHNPAGLSGWNVSDWMRK